MGHVLVMCRRLSMRTKLSSVLVQENCYVTGHKTKEYQTVEAVSPGDFFADETFHTSIANLLYQRMYWNRNLGKQFETNYVVGTSKKPDRAGFLNQAFQRIKRRGEGRLKTSKSWSDRLELYVNFCSI